MGRVEVEKTVKIFFRVFKALVFFFYKWPWRFYGLFLIRD
jgi:hypothetical protein